MILILILDILKNLYGFLRRSGLYNNFLKASFQGSVFLYVLTVFIQCGCTNTLYFASGQSGFEHVGGIQRTGSTTSPNQGMKLINE